MQNIAPFGARSKSAGASLNRLGLVGIKATGPERCAMIERYSDHAANERTFLAWVRTAIAIMAFGFLVEKFDLAASSICLASSLRPGARTLQARRPSLLASTLWCSRLLAASSQGLS